jgi:hypothetical protein
MYRPSKILSLDLFIVDKELLLAIEQITDCDIRDMYREPGDEEYTDAYITQETLPYKSLDPLYMKMLHRFRNCNRRLAMFRHQLTPGCQQSLSMRFLTLKNTTNREYHHHMLEFLAWTSNMLGRYHIEMLFEGCTDDVIAAEVTLWNTKPIEFFLSLNPIVQAGLITQYNEQEIIPMNRFNAEAEADYEAYVLENPDPNDSDDSD